MTQTVFTANGRPIPCDLHVNKIVTQHEYAYISIETLQSTDFTSGDAVLENPFTGTSMNVYKAGSGALSTRLLQPTTDWTFDYSTNTLTLVSPGSVTYPITVYTQPGIDMGYFFSPGFLVPGTVTTQILSGPGSIAYNGGTPASVLFAPDVAIRTYTATQNCIPAQSGHDFYGTRGLMYDIEWEAGFSMKRGESFLVSVDNFALRTPTMAQGSRTLITRFNVAGFTSLIGDIS